MREWKLTTFAFVSVIAAALASSGVALGKSTPFPMHHGVNLVQPFMRIVRLPKVSSFNAPVFQGMSYYLDWYAPSDLKALGYDFIRLPVNAGVLLANSPKVRAQLLDEVDKTIREFFSAGIKVDFDLHFANIGDDTWTNPNITADPNSPAFAKYRELVQEVTAHLVHFPKGMVALEPLNEPAEPNCASWYPEQRLLLTDIRAKAPDLPVVITGCQGELPELVKLTPNDIDMHDPNLIYTFHFYLPFVFTHQGGYPTFMQVEDLPYPSSLGSEADTLAKTNAAIDAAGLPSLQALQNKRQADQYIKQYYEQGANRDFIMQQIGMVASWAQTNHIPNSRLLMGENAAINWRKTDTPEYKASRLRWDNDVQSVADEFGIASCYWFLPYPKGPVFR